uniref:Domain of unknown function DB domain-containing protein n=1 Tax=Romanomermis culicivorax TaxID=13658 RepID=A0A915HDJ9_ROMCU
MHIWYGSLFFLLRHALESDQLDLPSCDEIFPTSSISLKNSRSTDSLVFSLCYSKRIRDLCREHCAIFDESGRLSKVVDRTILNGDSNGESSITTKVGTQGTRTASMSITTVQTVIKTTSTQSPVSSKCTKSTPCVDDSTANSRFLECCQNSGVPEKIYNLCNYNVNAMEIQNAVVDGSFPVKFMKMYQSCAANDQNNVDCCNKKNLLSGQRNVCQQFCDPTKYEWPTTLAGSMKFYPCMQINPQIMQCHRASLV